MTETTRQSLLDVVEGNLKTINYSTYITRFLYFGEYFHSSDELQEVMGKIVNALNGNSNENLITGLLLVYPRFYMHLLEADEVAGLLFNLNEKIPQYLPEMTVLEFLLNVKSNVLTTVEDYLRIYRDVPFIQFYGDTIWPPPSDNIPRYDALEKCVDRLTDEDDVIRKKI
ncbi:PREDICTED: uncharacterized protein LOC106788933 isoform X2 [Polistes canadensis]|uniref:uncharacterized protein LOC106788933 isoform X2 n=1 Tax=Polistes canadensis TaxID=91411 RepID=UPI000718AFBD|nr:PREDICTED: uncharacterized protein LOC106788933 isoform X2 [Polistes canadensis]